MTYAPRVPAVVYEVVVDRFRVGGGLTSAQKLALPAYQRPGMLVDTAGDGALLADTRVHHGGDLAGITEALPHLESLSVTGLCLTSIFKATRADKDGVQDFSQLDPVFGDEAAFKTLLVEAAKRGMTVILDGVFPYTGADHPWFVSARQHTTEDEARLDPSERTRGFYFFEGDGPDKFATYHGEPDHPELNLQSHELRRRLFTGERGVVHEWLLREAGGWRLSRSDELGYTVLREIALSARTGGEGTFIIGDARGWADRFVKDGLLDGVMNRYLREAMVAWLQGQIPAAHLARILSDQAHRYGRDALNRCWTFLSSHDTRRVAAALKGDMERVRLAVSLMYALPGAATIYYGEEVGLGGRAPAHSHLPFEWDEGRWDQASLGHHQRLGKLKQEVPALHKGDVIDLTPTGDEDVLAFARTRRDPRETVVAIFNRAYRPQQRLLFLPVADWPDGLPLKDLMGGEGAVVRAGTLSVEVPPTGARLLVPDEAAATGHRFFRNL
jgi:alpha-glucosidase